MRVHARAPSSSRDMRPLLGGMRSKKGASAKLGAVEDGSRSGSDYGSIGSRTSEEWENDEEENAAAAATLGGLAAAHVPPTGASSSSSSLLQYWYEAFLIWAVVSIGAYLGAYLRVGISAFYRGNGTTPAGFTVLYAQLLGSAIMGVVSEFQKELMAGPRHHRLLYIFTATGLCGSITTFSSWHFETSKLFLQQLDTSPGSIGGSYNGGNILSWLTTLWLGFGLPLTALRGGQHLAQACRKQPAAAVTMSTTPNSPVSSSPRLLYSGVVAEACIVVIYVLSTGLVGAVPWIYGWPALTYTALLGALGAYARYLLGPLNKGISKTTCGGDGGDGGTTKPSRCGCCFDGNFPVGTFSANLLGSIVQAVSVSLSKFVVSYHDHDMQALLFGVSIGFCGCLTTLSSFALELHRLPRRASYVYGAASYAVCILAYGVLFTAPAAYLATTAARSPLAFGPHVDVCVSYVDTCARLLERIGCPPASARVSGCGDDRSLATFTGVCECGSLDASSRISELLIDAQSRQRVAGSMVPVWASLADSGGVLRSDDAGEAVDLCLSYATLCANVLNRVECPAGQRVISACGRRSLREFAGVCECGAFTAPSTRVADLLLDHLLTRRYDLLPFIGYPGAAPLSLCAAFDSACTDLLDHALCPPAERVVRGCAEGTSNASTGWEGACTCFSGGASFTLGSGRVPAALADALLKPAVTWGAMVRLDRGSGDAGSAMVRGDRRGDGNHTTTAMLASSSSAASRSKQLQLLRRQPHQRQQNSPSSPLFFASPSQPLFDACASFDAICVAFLDAVACPPAFRSPSNAGCNATTSDSAPTVVSTPTLLSATLHSAGSARTTPNGSGSSTSYGHGAGNNVTPSPAGWIGVCDCGMMNIGTLFGTSWVIDAVLAGELYDDTYVAAPVTPFDLVVSSNPFRPLLAPTVPLPGDD